jgi:ubiquinone/menaquinone biosynthesis C-methylase UbiE
MENRHDLSGTGFGNVDETGYAASFISYLDTVSSHFKDIKIASYALLRLRPGDSVLDVGCGVGDDLRQLAEMVGPGGRAIGVDKSHAMIDAACERFLDSGLPLEFHVGEAEQLRWAGESFDACRADRVLQHLENPDRCLAEMVRVLKPGGRIVVIDRDWGLVGVDADDEITTEIVLRRASRGIRNGWVGRRLHRMLLGLGITEESVRVIPVVLNKFTLADALLDLTTVARLGAGEGLITAENCRSWLECLEQRDHSGTFFSVVTIVLASGRRPLPNEGASPCRRD